MRRGKIIAFLQEGVGRSQKALSGGEEAGGKKASRDGQKGEKRGWIRLNPRPGGDRFGKRWRGEKL